MDQQPIGPTPEGGPSPTPAPTPAPQPMQPMQPPAPAPMPMQPMQPQPTPVMPPVGGNGGPNKKLIMGIIGGVIALIVVIVGVVLAMTLGSVSQKDYEDAYDIASDARSAYTQMSTAAYINTSGTKTELENDLDDLKQARDKFDSTTAELADTKAVKADGEAKKLHEAFAAKKKDFDAAMDAIIEVYEHILPAVSEVNDSIYTSGSRATAAQNMLDAFESIDKNALKDANNKEFVDKMVNQLKVLLKTSKAYDKRLSGDYDPNIYTNYSDARTAVDETLRDWKSNFEKAAGDSEINEEFNDLGEYLAKKASGISE